MYNINLANKLNLMVINTLTSNQTHGEFNY